MHVYFLQDTEQSIEKIILFVGPFIGVRTRFLKCAINQTTFHDLPIAQQTRKK